MAKQTWNPGALLAPVPPALITVGDKDKHNVLTIGWTGILNTKPPKTYISVRPERYSYPILKEKGEFTINLPTADMVRSVDFCGVRTGARFDKFKLCNLTAEEGINVSSPSIAECPISVECKVTDTIMLGSHEMFMADILTVRVSEDVIDKTGKLCIDKCNLLAYAHGTYFSLGKELGTFGFSVKKKKKRSKYSKK